MFLHLRTILIVPCLVLVLAEGTGCGQGSVCKPGVPDGTPCGGTTVCSAGTCVDRSTTRTISGTFQTIYKRANGSTTTVSEPLPGTAVVTGLIVPDGSAQGYARIPMTVGADGHFDVSGVPVGKWFLQLDTPHF